MYDRFSCITLIVSTNTKILKKYWQSPDNVTRVDIYRKRIVWAVGGVFDPSKRRRRDYCGGWVSNGSYGNTEDIENTLSVPLRIRLFYSYLFSIQPYTIPSSYYGIQMRRCSVDSLFFYLLSSFILMCIQTYTLPHTNIFRVVYNILYRGKNSKKKLDVFI